MPRVSPALVVAGVLFAQAVVFMALVQFASPALVFFAGPAAGMVGAGACLVAKRANFAKPASEEPWALDAWGSLLAGLVLPMLGWSVGPEAATTGFLLVALHAGLGTMALAGR